MGPQYISGDLCRNFRHGYPYDMVWSRDSTDTFISESQYHLMIGENTFLHNASIVIA